MNRAKAIGNEYGVEAFDSYETMIEKTRPDGVIIATPTSTHAKIALNVAEKYDVKGILIENAIVIGTIDLEDAEIIHNVSLDGCFFLEKVNCVGKIFGDLLLLMEITESGVMEV